MASSRWIVAQIGAREHYAPARAFARRGTLERLYTDFWASPLLVQHAKRLPGPGRALGARFHPEVPSEQVRAWNAATLREVLLQNAAERGGAASTAERYAFFAQTGAAFTRRVARHLERHWPSSQNSPADRLAFFGYNTGCLELLPLLRERGVWSVVDQIDPGRVEEEIVRAEMEKRPGWATSDEPIPDFYYERLQAEWEAASQVLVNSPWSREALMKQGVPPQKIIVVPLAFEAPPIPDQDATTRRSHNAAPVVLWLGTVLLRKGIAYLIEAAQLLPRVRFVVAGELHITEVAIKSAPPNVEFVGRVARPDAARLYQEADLFVLPTLSDGFAITQLEAMAHGLPVIATPRCGEVVTPGEDGLIIPPGDAHALAQAIEALTAKRERLEDMGQVARQTARRFSLDRYAELLELEVAE